MRGPDENLSTPLWAGVDVGAARKGFHIAIVDRRRLLALHAGVDLRSALAVLAAVGPTLVGVDAPRSPAEPGASARVAERELAGRVCGIRWTPDRMAMVGNPYYAWVHAGLDLFAALAAARVPAVEVFPTASFTRWIGPRAGVSRAAWSSRGVAALGLAGTPERTDQDTRDAIAAAVTARAHSDGTTETIGGEIVVPLAPLGEGPVPM